MFEHQFDVVVVALVIERRLIFFAYRGHKRKWASFDILLCDQLVGGLGHCLGIFSLSRHACGIPALRVIFYSLSQTQHPLKSLRYVFFISKTCPCTP
jgi:hypothetical protein